MRNLVLFLLILTSKLTFAQEVKFIANWPLMTFTAFEKTENKIYLVYSGNASNDYSVILTLNENGDYLDAHKFVSSGTANNLTIHKKLENGNFLLAGTINQNGFLSLTDSSYNVIWIKTLSGTNAFENGKIIPENIEVADTIFYLISKQIISTYNILPLVTAFDFLGNEIWTKSFINNYFYKPTITVIAENGDLICFTVFYYNQDAFPHSDLIHITRLNSTGEIVYSKGMLFNSPDGYNGYLEVKDVLLKPNGNIMLACESVFSFPDFLPDLYKNIFFEISENFDVLSSKQVKFLENGSVYYGSLFHHFIQQDSSIFISNKAYFANQIIAIYDISNGLNNMVVVNENKEPENFYLYGGHNNFQRIKKENENFIQAGVVNCSQNNYISLNVIDSNFVISTCFSEDIGNTIQIDTFECLIVDSLIATNDNLIFMNSETINIEEFLAPEFLTFCGSCEILKLENKMQNKFSVFPNPSIGIFTLQLENDYLIAIVEVVDMFGRKVFQQQINRSENKSDILLDLSNLTAGIYIVDVTNIATAQKHTQKIIIH